MTDSEINTAIAEACGWKAHDHPECMAKKEGWIMPENWIMRPDGDLVHCIPNYCNDLNAMHEAEEQGLKGNQLLLFALLLDNTLRAELFGIRATARERAEAFLRTLGRWKE